MADGVKIQTIQFKRGEEAALTAKLKAEGQGVLGVLKAGEPAYATDTYVLKIGDGIHDYADLTPISGGGEDDRFVIIDPEANQILIYDANQHKWVNSDADSFFQTYIDAAAHEADRARIEAGNAANKAEEAERYASTANNAKADAIVAAQNATAAAESVEPTLNRFIRDKFWYGTLAQYNELEQLDDGTFYFITAED